jgi:hypothetical protein
LTDFTEICGGIYEKLSREARKVRYKFLETIKISGLLHQLLWVGKNRGRGRKACFGLKKTGFPDFHTS